MLADFDERAAVRAEIERREAAGVFIEDPEAPSLEERLEPFGIEWQIDAARAPRRSLGRNAREGVRRSRRR